MSLASDPKRAKTARGRRALEKMAPKLNENPRTALVLRGQKTSALVNQALTDLYMLKKPFSKHFTRHNAVHPFEDPTPLEFLCQKNDASLFAFGTHSKKRPHNLVLGRMFDHHLLDKQKGKGGECLFIPCEKRTIHEMMSRFVAITCR